MEIIKYKKTKDNIYEVILDNGSILTLFDETIMKYALLINKTITNELLQEITKYNEDLEAYYGALKFLSKKMRSELEVSKYLAKKEFSEKVINKTIALLREKGELDRTRFITSYINDQFNLTNNGPARIKDSLIKLGFSEDEISIEKDFTNKVQLLISKKVKVNHKLSTNNLKLQIANYLVNLGYPKGMFAEYLELISANNKTLIKKDYELLLKKYSKKYDSYKLKLFIKDKLYKKGYNIEEINEVMSDDAIY